ncbi:hypothetical protein GDO86_017173 [Hymenochirus boettgeri]|uniref:Uncharacterized protein n=1 Tax=Hymenochirus boettgeri TaxID=247094 RepID=A0A8T2IQS6_9PIPI|nr:hypothetical protein GDO86_017173 [Hymenochirus boettgeri]
MEGLGLEMKQMRALEKQAKEKHPLVTYASLVQNVMKMQRMFGVYATLTALKSASIQCVLLMVNLMIIHVKSKKPHARNRRKLKLNI